MQHQLPVEFQRIELPLLQQYIRYLKKMGKSYFLRNEIINEMRLFFLSAPNSFKNEGKETYLYRSFCNVPELIFSERGVVIVLRYDLARYHYSILDETDWQFREIKSIDYLNLRDQIISNHDFKTNIPSLNFQPFYDYFPLIKDSRSLGDGIRFLNRYLADNMFHNSEQWNEKVFNFLKIHSLQGKTLLIDGSRITNVPQLISHLVYLTGSIRKKPEKTLRQNIEQEMKSLGFAPGWGRTIEQIGRNMEKALALFKEPDPNNLEDFLTQIPMISRICVVSPHGFFGQHDVLGRPDTGGQVVYILDQVRYLEAFLRQSLVEAGLDVNPKIVILTRQIPESQGTTCHLTRELIDETNYSCIVRVPFTNESGNVVSQWISRFKIWPYLERFANEALPVLKSEFDGGQPDLIIGNYSDGNLVASLMAKKLGVTQCNIAHALEKTKYLFSDLYWQDMETQYHFSLQFTADLVAMNMASFIITSTSQEIAGTQEMRGQYESYQCFSMPGLYHVVNGIDLFYPKFNVVPPGVSDQHYFPFSQVEKRDAELTRHIEELLFKIQHQQIFGELDDPEKTPILLLSRLDKIKNISGFVEIYGQHPELQVHANLIIIAGKINSEESSDDEEKQEIHRLYELIDLFKLNGRIRWLGMMFTKTESGEIYRVIADHKGIFVQPALFEAFGLTVLEAMQSGLPVFATKFGGPREIIRPGVNGFLINPTLSSETAGELIKFFNSCQDNSKQWEKISKQGMKRISERYNWTLHVKELIKLAKIYGFWKYAETNQLREKLDIYCDVVYDAYFRNRLYTMKEN